MMHRLELTREVHPSRLFFSYAKTNLKRKSIRVTGDLVFRLDTSITCIPIEIRQNDTLLWSMGRVAQFTPASTTQNTRCR